MKRPMTVLLCAIPVLWAQAATLHLAGSSQLSDSGYPYYSWGTELGKYMSASHRVRNLAVSGASTKSYRESGKWKELIDGVEPGDFVGIQFGANDQKCSTEFDRGKRGAAPDGLCRDIWRGWVGGVRAKGATPVLISHSGRCTFDAEGRKIVDKESAPGVTLGSYSASAKALSEELGCAFVDMQTMVRELSESLGREEAYKNYVISVGWRKGKDGEPSKDTTHPIKSGAEAQSRLFRADVTRRGLSVAKLFQRPDFSPKDGFDAAFDAAERSGGGRVVVPRGVWQADEIRLRSRCDLQLDEGAVLTCAKVSAAGCTNVTISGTGTLRLARGGAVVLSDCQGVRVRDCRIEGADAVPLQILSSVDVSVRGVTVGAAGVDSLTVAGTRDIVVEKCAFERVDREALRRQAQQALIRDLRPMAEKADLVIYGSSPAAITAAIQAKRMGKTAIVVSPETRIGGLTTGGLGETDIGNKEAFGGLARDFYKAVHDHYADPASWTRQKPEDYEHRGHRFDPKEADTMWTFEPSVALKILEGWERRDGLVIHRGKRLDRSMGKVKVRGEGEQRRIVSFVTEDGTVYAGKMFVDATYEGDLMAAAGCSYFVGREANAVYGETSNGIQSAAATQHQLPPGIDPYVVRGDPKSGLLPNVEPYDPNEKDGDGDCRVQAYNIRMCLTDDPENRIPFAKPAGYDELAYELLFRAIEKGWDPRARNQHAMPNRKTDTNNHGGFASDLSGRSWRWAEASYAEREAIFREHLTYTQGFMWTLANHPRVPEEVRREYSRWGTCKDEFTDNTGDGWQSQLYVREARRLVGDSVVTEFDCRGIRKSARPVALAAYGMDSHHARRRVGADGFVHNEGDIQDYSAIVGGIRKGPGVVRFPPYGIDYGALVPKRGECANLFVPVCLSASHMAFGSIRMEPVFFELGQVAATAAAQAIDADAAVQDLPYVPLRERLLADGMRLDWTSLYYVDPFIGTEGLGSGYGGMQPYTTVPFGSIHVVPMTRMNRIGMLSFNSLDDTLIGFILTRQPAIWMGDWGAVRIPLAPAKIEKIESRPHWTRVTAGGRTWEMTATEHAAWIRGGYLALQNGCSRDRDDAHLGVDLPNFAGWRYVEHDADGLGVRIGVSLISLEQAKKNLAAEIGARSFGEVRDGAQAKWDELFTRVQIDAEPERRKIFYTALFHSLLDPRRIDEVHAGTMYSCFSLWDTYRAEHPWLTLIAPERVDAMMQSLLEMYREGGWLPKWPNPGYTGIMSGAPAEIVLAEACAKGFRGFDWNLAYEAVKKNATVPQVGDREQTWEDRGMFGSTPETRGGLASYMTRGYVACDETSESVSRTQDFGLADCAAAVLAEATDHPDEAAAFRVRAKNYTNLWNAVAGQFLPRKADGTFVAGDWTIVGKTRGYPAKAYCEQKPETATWAIPYDTDGLADLLGGKEAAVRRLDEFFDNLFFKPDGRGNRSIHGNEPSHHCAYLYNCWGAPEKTQLRVRQILTRCYSTSRKGFDGNEDCGQMSAWYILSSLGFYPLDPASGEYEIGSPAVRSATLTFGAPYVPATLEIKTVNYHPDNWRVKRVTLNGEELANWRVRHADLVKGGTLVFEMANATEL